MWETAVRSFMEDSTLGGSIGRFGVRVLEVSASGVHSWKYYAVLGNWTEARYGNTGHWLRPSHLMHRLESPLRLLRKVLLVQGDCSQGLLALTVL